MQKKPTKPVFKKKFLYLFFLSTFLLILSVSGFLYYKHSLDYHVHADFKVIILGESINFSQEKYQSSAQNFLHHYVHLHDSDGDVIHYHKQDIPLSDFFISIKQNLSNNCIIIENVSYCNNTTHNLEVFVNDQIIDDFQNYIADDLDRILIIYYNLENEDPKEYFSIVTDKACISSNKCPERGVPTGSSCVTGSTCSVDLNNLK